MGVKIKNNGEMVDATMEIIDGVIVVSPKDEKFEPKDEKFEPKDGDVVYVKSSWDNIIIYKEDASGIGRYVNFSGNEYLYTDNNVVCDKDSVEEIRYATEEEKKKLFDKLAEKGYEFDFEKKELVKLKLKPKEHETYYSPWIDMFDDISFFLDTLEWENHRIDKMIYNKGWNFKTKEECQEFCDRLNEAISSVKP